MEQCTLKIMNNSWNIKFSFYICGHLVVMVLIYT
jgi:hypothetical protein